MKRISAVGLRLPRTLFPGVAILAAAVALGLPPAGAGHDDGPFLPRGPGERIRNQRPDHELRNIMRDIDRRQIENTVRTLAGFGTRHTLSSRPIPIAASARRPPGCTQPCRATPPSQAVA